MSNSNQDQTREEKIAEMNSMCTMIKGKQTYKGLTRRQWIDRFLEWNPTTDPNELAEGDFHIVELAEACECQEEAADLGLLQRPPRSRQAVRCAASHRETVVCIRSTSGGRRMTEKALICNQNV